MREQMEPMGEVKYKKPDRCLYVHLCGCGASSSEPHRHRSCSCGRWGLCCVGLIVFLVLAAAIAAIVLLVLYFTTELLPMHYGSNGRVYVQTPMGEIRGSLKASPGGNDVEEFLGIPFAEPPIGNLRFADPVAIKKFKTQPLVADHHGASCMQAPDLSQGDFWGTQMWNPPGKISEDCLYLNVWAPTPRRDQKRPVMLWIFGGGFTAGTSSLPVYDGKVLAAFGDVVVVSFNYRVGALGYLATGDGRIKGNFGQKDQAMVIRWVHDHIAAFGGDSNQVTLFGESAGGASVGYSMLSPLTRDLFQRAIIASASPNANWALMKPSEAQRHSTSLFKAVGCDNLQNRDELLTCLRDVPAQTMVNNQFVNLNFLVFPFSPVVDGDYLTDTPYNLMLDPSVPKKDILLGANKDEGSFWLLYYLKTVSPFNASLHTYQQFLDGMNVIAYDLSAENRQKLVELYTEKQIKDPTDKAANRDALDRSAGDRSFTCPSWDLAQTLSRQGKNVYYYYLTYRASNELWPEWMGVIHGADCQWMFGDALVEQTKQDNFNDADRLFAKEVMTYITNFAKTGNPNNDGLTTWPRLEMPNRKYLEWRGPSNFRPNVTFREPFCEFWRDINSKYFNDQQIR